MSVSLWRTQYHLQAKKKHWYPGEKQKCAAYAVQERNHRWHGLLDFKQIKVLRTFFFQLSFPWAFFRQFKFRRLHGLIQPSGYKGGMSDEGQVALGYFGHQKELGDLTAALNVFIVRFIAPIEERLKHGSRWRRDVSRFKLVPVWRRIHVCLTKPECFCTGTLQERKNA